MTAKTKRPAGGRANEISWGDYTEYTARSYRHVYGGAYVTPAIWTTWEMKRWLAIHDPEFLKEMEACE